RDLRAAAESGWDFGSRWLADGKTLRTIHTTDFVSPDLNSLLYQLELTIAKGCEVTSDTTCAKDMQTRAARRKAAVDKILWNATLGAYNDYDLTASRRRPRTPVSNGMRRTAGPHWNGLLSAACATTTRQRWQARSRNAGSARISTSIAAPASSSKSTTSPAPPQAAAASTRCRTASAGPTASCGISSRSIRNSTPRRRARHDFGNHALLRVRVVLHVRPGLGGELLLRAGIQGDILWSDAQPVAEQAAALELGAAGRKHVQVRLRRGALEQPVLEPFRLANDQTIARALQRRTISRFVGRIAHGELDVDHRFCRETRYGSRPDVLDEQRGTAERGANLRLLGLEQPRPAGIVGHYFDLAGAIWIAAERFHRSTPSANR